MTEKEWLTGTCGEVLAEYWGTKFTKRKAHLLMLACCRRHPTQLKHATLHAALDAISTHFADPLKDEPFESEHLRELYPRVHTVARGRSREPGRGVAFGVLAAVEPESIAEELKEEPDFLVYSCLHDIASGWSGKRAEQIATAQAALVREVVGNPFKRPKVKVKPAWRTDTVLALARQMYAADEFGAMPILADALQDAGCNNEDILSHCRDTALAHVRGCWVVDLILGKQ